MERLMGLQKLTAMAATNDDEWLDYNQIADFGDLEDHLQ